MDRSLQPGYSRRGIVLARLCFLLSSIQCSDACQHYVRTLTSLNVRSRRALGSWHYIHISGGVWCAWHHLIYCCPVFVDVVNPSSRFIDPGCKSTRRHHADAIVFFVPKTTNEPSTARDYYKAVRHVHLQRTELTTEFDNSGNRAATAASN